MHLLYIGIRQDCAEWNTRGHLGTLEHRVGPGLVSGEVLVLDNSVLLHWVLDW